MHFSIGCGLTFMLLFLPVHGEFKCENTNLNLGDVDCPCRKSSPTYYIKEPVSTCFEQKKDADSGSEAHPKLEKPHVLPPEIWENCCIDVSSNDIQEDVVACCKQNKIQSHCNRDAYIFVGESNKCHCVDPSAPWIEQTLEELAEKGIYCKDL